MKINQYEFKKITSILEKDYPISYGISRHEFKNPLRITNETNVWDLLLEVYDDLIFLREFINENVEF